MGVAGLGFKLGGKMKRTMKKSIAIIGGGVIGLSAAYHLARRGARVTVIDGATPGGGATAGSFAWINAASMNGSTDYYRLRLQSLLELQRFERDLALPVKHGGRLEWRDDEGDLAREYAILAGLGYAVQWLDREDVSGLEPALIDPPERAVFTALESSLDPEVMISCLVAGAERLGVEIRGGCRVTGFTVEQGAVRGVTVEDGSVEADCVVLAAGVDSEALAATVGLRLPMANSPGLLTHTAPAPPLLGRVVLTPTVHMKQDLDGRIVAAWDFAGGPVPDDIEREGERLLAAITALLRLEEPLVLDDITVALRPQPEDGFPIVGFAKGPDNLYVTVMHSGITLAPLIGRLAAAEILDGVVAELLAPFRPNRYNQ
jgi:glycine/D-amino acid oxidase-like deaminating enzyme